jgi:peptidoglycan/LPS O-acetylase OafA/YrhL
MAGLMENVAQKGVEKKQILHNSTAEVRPQLNFSSRIRELDGYRGLAVAVCLSFHYVWVATLGPSPDHLNFLHKATSLLWSGMEMFFVLSGFLIGGILLDARNSPNYFSTYYIRRFCRILPVYFLFVGLVGIAFLVVYKPMGSRIDWAFGGNLPWYSYLTFTQNFSMAKGNNFGMPILGITWSLAVEEQFYLVLPLIIRFVRRSALPYVFMAGIVIAPLVRLFIVYKFRSHLLATYVLLPSRMDSLFIGVLCAYYLREPRVWNWLVNHRSTVWKVLLGLLAGMPILSNAPIPYSLLWIVAGIAWMSVFFASILILAVTDSQSLLSRTLRWRWFTGLGAIGYSVYLFHQTIYSLCMFFLGGHGWQLANWRDFGATLLALAITLSFSKFLWSYFEKPIVRWGQRRQYESRANRSTVIDVPHGQSNDDHKALQDCKA